MRQSPAASSARRCLCPRASSPPPRPYGTALGRASRRRSPWNSRGGGAGSRVVRLMELVLRMDSRACGELWHRHADSLPVGGGVLRQQGADRVLWDRKNGPHPLRSTGHFGGLGPVAQGATPPASHARATTSGPLYCPRSCAPQQALTFAVSRRNRQLRRGTSGLRCGVGAAGPPRGRVVGRPPVSPPGV